MVSFIIICFCELQNWCLFACGHIFIMMNRYFKIGNVSLHIVSNISLLLCKICIPFPFDAGSGHHSLPAVFNSAILCLGFHQCLTLQLLYIFPLIFKIYPFFNLSRENRALQWVLIDHRTFSSSIFFIFFLFFFHWWCGVEGK